MRTYLFVGVAAAAIGGFALIPLAAHADPISIGLQEAGYNGDAIATQTSGTLGVVSIAGLSYGTFSSNSVAGTGSPILPQPTLDSSSITVTTALHGVLKVYISETSLTGPLGPYNMLSSFAAPTFTGTGMSQVIEATYVDTGNRLYGLGTLLASHTFTGGATGFTSVDQTPDFTGPYSLTEVYTIDSSGGNGSFTGSMVTQDVPEPGSLALLGTALAGLGMVGWACKKQRIV